MLYSYINIRRGRNYLFMLNENFSLDASLLGNEARFINHARGDKVNCEAICKCLALPPESVSV